jgi:polyferredoxin
MMILLDIAVIRHFWCRFACIYKIWQHSFKTEQTLHVLYDASRSNECEKCNFCVTTCFIDLDPRKTEIYDSCINCGDCIDACNKLQARKGNTGLLKFELGQRESRKIRQLRDGSMSLLGRLRWTAPFALLGLILFAWGVWSYQPYHMSVGYLTTAQNQSARDYRVEIASKRYRATEITVSVEGLPQGAFTLSGDKVKLESVGRASLVISMSPTLQRGLHPFVVVARSNDGWIGRFNMQHFVE